MLAALDDLDESRVEERQLSGRRSPTRTCTTALERGTARSGSARSAASCGPAGGPETTRWPTDLRLYLRDHARLIVSRPRRACRRR